MRVALAALLFSEPDVLLLDEPSNHLDLEATLWLENFLKSYPGTMVVISHERDLLNNVVDTILHLEGGKVTLYTGGYDSFERQRAERAAQTRRGAGVAGRPAQPPAGLYRPQQRPRLDRQAGPVARQDAGQDAADRRACRRSEPELRFPEPERTEAAADHARHGGGRLWPTRRCCSGSTCASIPTTASRCSAATATARPRWRGCSRRSWRRWRARCTRRARCGSAISPNIRSRNCTATIRRCSI